MLGRSYAWPDRLGPPAINRRMSPGPRQGPLERGAGAFGASPIETVESRARRPASCSRPQATRASTRTGTWTLKRMELAMASGMSATKASIQRKGMALSRWCSAGKPLVLTLRRRRKGRGRDWMWTRKLGRLGQVSGRGVRPGQRRGWLNPSIWTIENYRGTVERK